MRKGRNNLGSVYYLKDRNRFMAQHIEIDKNGKKKYIRKQFKTEEEAKKYLDTVMYQKSNSLYIEHNGIPLVQLMRMNAKKKLDMNLISKTQYARINKTIDIIEKSNIAYKKIDELTADDIQEYLNTLKDYSNSSIKKVHSEFTQAYTQAMNKGYIYKNPMADVIKPKSNKEDKIVRALQVEEQQEFTKYLLNTNLSDFPNRNALLIQMYMGLRIGEVLALSNYDIDIKHNVINLENNLSVDENGNLIKKKGLKTKAGEREIPIPKYMLPYIIEQMKIGENNRDKQLFLSENGNYVDPRNVNRVMKKILKDKWNITDISTHSLRHTYGTRCIEAGMSAVALQRLMGHNDVSVTLNTYTSVFNKYKKEELEKVNNYYISLSLIHI